MTADLLFRDQAGPDADLERGLAIILHSKNGERRVLAITGPVEEVLRKWSKVRRIDCDLLGFVGDG